MCRAASLGTYLVATLFNQIYEKQRQTVIWTGSAWNAREPSENMVSYGRSTCRSLLKCLYPVLLQIEASRANMTNGEYVRRAAVVIMFYYVHRYWLYVLTEGLYNSCAFANCPVLHGKSRLEDRWRKRRGKRSSKDRMVFRFVCAKSYAYTFLLDLYNLCCSYSITLFISLTNCLSRHWRSVLYSVRTHPTAIW